MEDKKVDDDKLGHENFHLVPLRALNVSCRRQLSIALLPERPLPTSSGFTRDWQGLCELAGFSYDMIKLFKSHSDPVAEMLEFWGKQQTTIRELVSALELMERFDIIEDIQPLLEKDVLAYIRKQERDGKTLEAPSEFKITSGGSTVTLPLTVGDVIETSENSSKYMYDAYVSYMDSDSDFVAQMVEELEGNFNLKLFIKDRDMLPGVIESEADLTLINERCDKILLIVSQESLTDPHCEFQTVVAQAAAVDSSLYARKVIPIICKPCVLPSRFKILSRLDYTKKDLFGGFWKRLYCSIKSDIQDGYVPTTMRYSTSSSPEINTASSQGPLLNLNSISASETRANATVPDVRLPGPERKTSLLSDCPDVNTKANSSPPAQNCLNLPPNAKSPLSASPILKIKSEKHSAAKSPQTTKNRKFFNTSIFGRKTSS